MSSEHQAAVAGADLDARTIVTPNAGFAAAEDFDHVALLVFGMVLECPGCRQPTTALLAFLPRDADIWDQNRIVLCNTDLSLAVADAATPEIVHIVNTVGRPAYPSDPDADLVNRCFHCDHPLSGDDLAAEVRRSYLDGLVELGHTHAPRRWVSAAVAGSGSFVNHGDVPCPDAVPDFHTPTSTLGADSPS